MAISFGTYVLSFVFRGIYWNNHHHLLHAATRINGKILWANLHLLFWLSLVPFGTRWVGESHFAPLPMALYADVTQVLVVGRSVTGQKHAKLREIAHEDFYDFSAIENEMAGYDACFFCLGVSSVGMKEEQYRHVTYDLTMA